MMVESLLALIVLAVIAIIFYIVIIAYGVAYGMSIYDRWKRKERRLNKFYREQEEKARKYAEEHPPKGRFYDGGIRYGD